MIIKKTKNFFTYDYSLLNYF
ncbi:hypothetical protein XFF6991_4914 [Xanthomonas phaseoli pv. phaseoli]|uniref:Uncharacterized protein n=1 Tax=Xanthomonas campestris pv. phaseoli TaxID=317013 RepID=A0A7Z7IV37_XANCH|nr:hypothetical protein XFF6991_4914 [Xanthomonas phaseoli pv. phaseoli]